VDFSARAAPGLTAFARGRVNPRAQFLALAFVWRPWAPAGDRLRVFSDGDVTAVVDPRPWRPDRDGSLFPSQPAPGRNEPCWCGSGWKYKHCSQRSHDVGTRPRPEARA
jgi:hypothetical protein